MQNTSSTFARVSTEGAAAYTGLSASTLSKLRMSNEGPEFFKLGRRVVYDLKSLDEWLQSRRRKSTSDPGTAGAE